MTRAIVIPRGGRCWLRCAGGACVLDVTRIVEAWNDSLQIWVPELRLCHLHAIEYVTGQPVYMPDFESRQAVMRSLSA